METQTVCIGEVLVRRARPSLDEADPWDVPLRQLGHTILCRRLGQGLTEYTLIQAPVLRIVP